MKYIQEFDAIQYIGGNEVEIAEFIHAHSPDPEATAIWAVDRSKEELYTGGKTIHRRTWVIVDANNMILLAANTLFRKIFKAVKNTTVDQDDEAFAADVRDCLIRAQQLTAAPSGVSDAETRGHLETLRKGVLTDRHTREWLCAAADYFEAALIQPQPVSQVSDAMVDSVGAALYVYWNDVKNPVREKYRAKVRAALECRCAPYDELGIHDFRCPQLAAQPQPGRVEGNTHND